MKIKKLFFSVLFCGLSLSAIAQFSVGVRGSYVKAWQEYGEVDLPEDAQIHVKSYQVSGLFYYNINKHLEVGIEPGFVKRGAACEPGFLVFNPAGTETKLILNYAELPLMIAGRYPILGNKLELFAKIGGGISKAVNGYREVSTIGSDLTPVRTDIDFKNDNTIRSFDYGIYGNLGIAVNVGTGQLFLESNYYNGLSDVDRFNTSKNRGIQIGLGYMVRL